MERLNNALTANPPAPGRAGCCKGRVSTCFFWIFTELVLWAQQNCLPPSPAPYVLHCYWLHGILENKPHHVNVSCRGRRENLWGKTNKINCGLVSAHWTNPSRCTPMVDVSRCSQGISYSVSGSHQAPHCIESSLLLLRFLRVSRFLLVHHKLDIFQ